MNKNYFIYMPVLVYLLSLALPVINRPDENMYGIEVLFLGWIQSYFGIQILSEGGAALLNEGASLSVVGNLFLTSCSLVLPWLGNLIFVLAIYLMRLNNIVWALRLSFSAVLCVLTFWINPVAMLGESAKIILVTPLLGAYVWSLSIVLVLFSAIFLNWLINSRRKVD